MLSTRGGLTIKFSKCIYGEKPLGQTLERIIRRTKDECWAASFSSTVGSKMIHFSPELVDQEKPLGQIVERIVERAQQDADIAPEALALFFILPC